MRGICEYDRCRKMQNAKEQRYINKSLYDNIGKLRSGGIFIAYALRVRTHIAYFSYLHFVKFY